MGGLLIQNVANIQSVNAFLFISDNNIINIKCSIQETTIYTFSDKFNTESCINRYDKMRPLFFKIAHGSFKRVK